MPFYQSVIIGSGPAGYTAGIYLARAGFDILLITGRQFGGQLTLTHKIDNYPGVPHVSGMQLMDILHKQAQECGVKFLNEEVLNLYLDKKPFRLVTETLDLEASSLIIATGTSAKWLDIKGEAQFKGRGIGICALCDGPFFKEKEVAVIGGGNTALYEAIYLSEIVKKVFLIHRGSSFKAEKTLIEQVEKNPKIQSLFHTKVLEFKGGETLEEVVLEKEHKIFSLPIHGAFIAIGHTPNTVLFKSYLKMTRKGFIKTNKKTMRTSIEGVFACGDVQEELYRQAIVASGSGCIAALSTEKYLLKTI